MNDFIIWKGVNCKTMGAIATELPPYTVPTERAVFTDVPGRNGSLVTLEGDNVYADILLTVGLYVRDPVNIPLIAQWLRGSGELILANRPDRCYQARVNNQISFEKIMRGRSNRKVSVIFRCKPCMYHTGVAEIEITESAQTVVNPGTIPSAPKITIEGDGEHNVGDVAITIGDKTFTIVGVTDGCVIDSELMECYFGTTSLNASTEGEYPVFPVGSSSVTITATGTLESAVIEPRWRDI